MGFVPINLCMLIPQRVFLPIQGTWSVKTKHEICLFVHSLLLLSDRRGSGSGSILDSQNLGGFWQTIPHSHQFKQNPSGRMLFHFTQAEVNITPAWTARSALLLVLLPSFTWNSVDTQITTQPNTKHLGTPLTLLHCLPLLPAHLPNVEYDMLMLSWPTRKNQLPSENQLFSFRTTFLL